MVTEFTCLLCDAREAAPFLLDCQDYYLRKTYRADYYKCMKCGLVQQSPIPRDVHQFYEGYPVHRRKASLFELARRRIMKRCYFDVQSEPESREPGSVLLDFGCGDGWFLDSLKGQRLVRIGYEVDPGQATKLAEGMKIPVYSDEFTLLAAYRGKVDVITMHFVLEHIADLRKTLGLVHELLRPDGLLFITIPEISSWEFKLFRRKWHNLDPPRHICFPGRKGIQKICQRWGFDMEKSFPVPFPNGVAGSLSTILFGRFRFLPFLFMLPLGVLISRLFPSGNRAYVLKKLAREP